MPEPLELICLLHLQPCGHAVYEMSATTSLLLSLRVSSSPSPQPSPVIVQHLSSLGVDDVDNDASVPPAPLEQVVVLVALSGL